MKIPVYTPAAKSQTPWSLDLKPLGKFNSSLLAQALRVYEANAHQRTSRVKTRGEITGSTRKIYRQKGTGRARHGARSAPLFVGGGIAHGPTGLRRRNLCLPKKMKKSALKSALLAKLTASQVVGVTRFSSTTAQTSSALRLLSVASQYPKSKVLVIITDPEPRLYRGFRNLQRVAIKRASLVNAYDFAAADFIFLTPPAFANLLLRLSLPSSTIAYQS